MKSRITELEAQLETEKAKTKKYMTKLICVEKVLGKDQLDVIYGKKPTWSNSSIKKASAIRKKGGEKLLKYVSDNIVPLPSNSTVKERMPSTNYPYFSCILK